MNTAVAEALASAPAKSGEGAAQAGASPAPGAPPSDLAPGAMVEGPLDVPADQLWSISGRAFRRSSVIFTVLFVLAAGLTVAGAAFAVSGGGPLAEGGQPVVWLLGAGLLLTLGLGALLARRIWALFSGRAATEKGARLHLRFVSLFSLAAVVPAIAVAIFLGAALSRGVEAWFSERVRTVVESGADVGRSYVSGVQEGMVEQVGYLVVDLNAVAGELQRDPEGYRAFLSSQTGRLFFSRAYVINSKGEVLSGAELQAGLGYLAPANDVFAEAQAGATAVRIFEDDLEIRALQKLSAYPDAYVYVSRPVDARFLQQLREFSTAVGQYREAEQGRGHMQAMFALSYLAIALLVLLGAVWLGLSNASRIAQPIGRLAHAARRVAAGDLAARVSARGDRDEVDALSRAFNQMTAQLEAQREDLVRARREAEARSQFTQAVLAGVSAGVVGLDLEGRITAANRSAAQLLGAGEETLVGRKLVELAPEFTDLLQPQDMMGDGRPQRVDLNRPEGVVHLSVRRASNPGAASLVLTFDDQTKLVAAQRQEAWKDVARRIAHEIRNPLTPIQLSAERIRRKYSSQITAEVDTFQRCVDTILRQVGDIGRMVDEFSGFARMPAPRFAPADAAEIVRRAAFDQRISFADVRFEVIGAEAEAPLICDERLIGQALANVVKNAAEAIQSRRQKDGEPKDGRVLIRLTQDPAKVVIEVVDNGVGFPAQDRERLVEPYVTTRAKGTGLGLAIVKRVLEDHGGQLELEDAPGSGGPGSPGALVRFVLPRNTDAPAEDNSAGKEGL